MTIISNIEFLSALFAEDAPFVHVTDFTYDPSNIPEGRHLAAWSGDWFSRYNFQQQSNQYFTISIFNPDEQGKARRRKALFLRTRVIVLDDVKEKLSLEEVNKLPSPSWILETSAGSEQWGYILNTPCADRHQVENLLDGLVANGLAPDGKDPGMKGVTRYVRLPDGVNNKSNKLVNGQPFKCRLTLWNPTQKVSIDQLATPFYVNLNKVRRENRVDGASLVEDHPLLQLHDIIHIKEERSAGRYDITCPWVDEHTGADDNGAGIFTNADNTIGFKCHHGSCQHRTGRDLLNYIEEHEKGFKHRLSSFQTIKSFEEVSVKHVTTPSDIAPPPPVELVQQEKTLDTLIDDMNRMIPNSAERRDMSVQILKNIQTLSPVERSHYENEVRSIMGWSRTEFKNIIGDLKKEWYKKDSDLDFYGEVIYVGELNQFYNIEKNIFYSAEAYQNVYSHLDSEARKEALQGGRVMKVDRLDYAPRKTAVFVEKGVMYGNMWASKHEVQGEYGDIQRWLDHFDVLGWGQYRDHVMKWMAYTIRYPENKINHMLIFGSGEGSGKDWLLTPLVTAMGDDHTMIDGEHLLSQFNDYLMKTKYLHINEAELGDRTEAKAVSNKLKPLSSAPPFQLRVNQKGIKPIMIRNIVNCTMTTNSQIPVALTGPSRRIFALWTDITVRGIDGEMTDEWRTYWNDRWEWMNNGGAEAVIWYLRNVVDLSDFNPFTAPPVTDFLRDIVESSKSPMQQTIEAAIRGKIGVFNSDIMTASEIADTLRVGDILCPSIMYCNGNLFTPVRVGQVMKQIPGICTRDARSRGNRDKLYITRNVEKYQNMNCSELRAEYERQMNVLRSNGPLIKAVN